MKDELWITYDDLRVGRPLWVVVDGTTEMETFFTEMEAVEWLERYRYENE